MVRPNASWVMDTWDPLPPQHGQYDGQIQLKTLPSHNFGKIMTQSDSYFLKTNICFPVLGQCETFEEKKSNYNYRFYSVFIVNS